MEQAIGFAFMCCDFALVGLYAIFQSSWMSFLAIGLRKLRLT